jgi:hypothetical protein
MQSTTTPEQFCMLILMLGDFSLCLLGYSTARAE